jgi:hypothetical protein
VIVLRSENAGSVEVSIEVQDGVTEKHVQRELDLTSVPPDGRSLGIAVAADELLRASWIELALEGAPTSPATPPPEVEHTVRQSLSSSPYVAPSASRELEARAALDLYDLSARFLGADVSFRHFPASPWGYELTLGIRSIAEERADHGTIQGSALGAGAAGVVDLVHRKSFGAGLEVGAWAMQVRYQSDANPGVEGRTAAEVAVYARAGLAAVVRVNPTLAMRLRAGAGAPLRSVSVLDDNDVATGARGLGLFSSLGLAVGL